MGIEEYTLKGRKTSNIHCITFNTISLFQDGMGKLRITPDGVRVEGDAEFLRALYAKHIRSTDVSIMTLKKYIISVFNSMVIVYCTHK